MIRESVTMKAVLLFCVVQVVVFASLVSSQTCRTGFCVLPKYCLKDRLRTTTSEKCKMQSNRSGVCCDISRTTLGKNCTVTSGNNIHNGKCVPESSCKLKFTWRNNVLKTSNKDCSQINKNFYCCPENDLWELDATRVGSVTYEKPKDNPIVERNEVSESPTLVQNVFSICRTPDNQNGRCVPLQLCYPLNVLNEKMRDNIVKKHNCPSNAITSTSICCPNPVNSSSFILHPKAAKLGFGKCGSVSMDEKVLAGEKAGLGQYPWMANLMYRVNKTHLEPMCGGSLIHPKYVLTAAHCRHPRYSLVAVRLGEYDLSKKTDCEEGECAEPFREYSIDTFISHPQYNRYTKRDLDIALIKLKTRVTIVPGQIVPICLPLTDSLLMLKPKQLTVTGWGMTESGKVSDVLLKADLALVDGNSFEDCRKESMFCARGAKREGHCKGDSGGPMQAIVPIGNTYRTVVFGVVGRGASKCAVNIDLPGVSVLVGYHIRWILDNMDI